VNSYPADLKLQANRLNNVVNALEHMALDMDMTADSLDKEIQGIDEVTLICNGTPREKLNKMYSIVERVFGGPFRDKLEKLSYEVNYNE
jgi:hypothetical protein